MNTLFDETIYGLDCIDLTYYADGQNSVYDIADEIQMDFERWRLPHEAMEIFLKPSFHGDVFRAMDDSSLEEYLVGRLGIGVLYAP